MPLSTNVNIGTVQTNDSGPGWSLIGNTLSLQDGADITVTGTATGRDISFNQAGAATVTLDNLVITSGITQIGTRTLTINLQGINTIRADGNSPGI